MTKRKINPIIAAGFMVDAMADAALGIERAHRADVFRDEWKQIAIDTCYNPVVPTWETGISQDGGNGPWTIVETYGTREEAEQGHTLWVKQMKKNPQCELPDLDLED